MSKKTNLNEALHQASGKKSPVAVATEETEAEMSAQSALPPSRRGKKTISGYFDPAVSTQLKRIALDYDTTQQALLTEAINDLFEKYSQKAIA